ncbi:unnamed protein product, partial [Ixodes pacificus]
FRPGPRWVPAVVGRATSASSTEVRLPDGKVWERQGDHPRHRVSEAEVQPSTEAEVLEPRLPPVPVRQHLEEADEAAPWMFNVQEGDVVPGWSAAAVVSNSHADRIPPSIPVLPQSPVLRRSTRVRRAVQRFSP